MQRDIRHDVEPFEQLEGRRLLSATYTMSGGTDVLEGDYQLTLAVQGAAGSTIQSWNIDWDGDGLSDQSVNPSGAASIVVTRNLDGPAELRVRATATLTDTSTVQVESANHNGYLDTTFNPSGTVPGTRVDIGGLPKSAVVDSDGGTIIAYQDNGPVRLRRYTPSGAVDTSWGNDALTHTAVVPFSHNDNGDELSLLIHQGSLYVGGTSDDGTGDFDMAVARFGLATGTPDTSFGPGGLKLYELGGVDSINSLATQGTSIIAAGHSTGQAKLVRLLNTTGAMDTTFGTAGVASSGFAGWQPADIAVMADQSIIAAGRSNSTGLVVAKYRSNGTQPVSDGTNSWTVQPISTGYGLHAPIALRAGGKVVIGGDVTGNVSLVGLNADGSLDVHFDNDGLFTYDSGGSDEVYELIQQPDGTLVTLGGSAPTAGNAHFAVHGFRSLGDSVILDTTFGQDVGTGHTFTTIGPVSEIRAATVTAGGSIVAAGFTDFGPNNKILMARYGGDMGVSVTNVAPQIIVPATVNSVPGHRLTFTVIEPSQADRDFLYSGTIDFDFHEAPPDDLDYVAFGFDAGNNFGEAVPTHVYTTNGTYRVLGAVFDKDGDGQVLDFTVNIARTAVTADPVNPGKTVLLVGAQNVGGAGDNNVISISRQSTATRVVVDGVTTNVSGVVDRVLVYGNAGNDDISIAANFTQPVELYGGAGTDRLRGGSASDILVGGDGIDLVSGGSGRDLLIGDGAPTGAVGSIDRINGDANDDILIGANTVFADRRDALNAILAEWNSTRTYLERVANLRTGTGTATRLNRNAATGENFFLVADVTVFDDGVVDVLTGGNGQDWFFADVDGTLFVRDFITDLSASEFADDLDFINAP